MEDVPTPFTNEDCIDLIGPFTTSNPLKSGGVKFDPSGLSGADNSHYLGGSGQLAFGEGGVDDAEDADVIVHEFGHALSDHASPLSNTGLERRAIDEGYGDYFAASYSRKFSDYNWENIFS